MVFPSEKIEICMLALSHLAATGRKSCFYFFVFFFSWISSPPLIVFASAFPACVSAWFAGGGAPVQDRFNLGSPSALRFMASCHSFLLPTSGSIVLKNGRPRHGSIVISSGTIVTMTVTAWDSNPSSTNINTVLL